MDQVNPYWLSATGRAGHRQDPTASEGLIASQKDCELSHQEHESYHPRDDVAESHDHGHKRRRLDDHGTDHTSATSDPGWDVSTELSDVDMEEDDAIHKETNEVVLQPAHLSSQPSNDPNCALAAKNSNLLPNTGGAIVSTDGIKISDVCLLNPPPKDNPKYKIAIKCGITDSKTPRSVGRKGKCDNNRVIWNEPFVFSGDITDKTLLTFTVRNKQFLTYNTIGTWKCWATDLIEVQSKVGSCRLDVSGECQLTFNIKKISGLDVVSGMVEQASAGLASLPNLKVPLAQAATVINSAAQVYNDNEETWTSFLDTFKVFMKVMDNVSEINIYAQMAWGILSIIPKTILSKKNRDDKVKQLCERLRDIYEYITDAEWFHGLTKTHSTNQSTDQHTKRSIARWSTMLSTLVKQTIECLYFIEAYGTESTAKNIAKAIGGSVDTKIQAFNDKLDHLTKVMTDSVNLETGIITLRISGEIMEQRGEIMEQRGEIMEQRGEIMEQRGEIMEQRGEIIKQCEQTLLGEMPYDPDAGFFPKKRCLPGTRQTLINEILKWINNDSLPQILVLSGQAGVGKSSVAHTIAEVFQQQNRLGSMFCFNRSFPDRRNCLFSTISRDLADSDILWRKELVKVINTSAVRKKKDAETQFEELVLKPSKNVITVGSVVVVVDALDESGERNERGDILKLLLDRWCGLPKNYRLIVTTRPEQDIELRCQNGNVQCIRMSGIDAEETRSDIEAYVSDCLAPISSILDEINRDWRSILAKRAEGLFQWAQTVCHFINPTIRHPQLIEKKWEACVSKSSLSLYGLYRQIISSQAEARDEDFIKNFKTIVGAIITAREPLSMNALQNMFDDIKHIELILIPFGSFFVGVHDLSTPVRPVHTSLFDFFISKKNAEEYCIDTSDQSRMALGCLKVMDRMLCFNICQLETSHLRNKNVPDFDARVGKVIPFHLSYSCRFWAVHLRSSPLGKKLIREVRKLMDDKLLYYFEALSLLYAVDRGCMTMREIVDWCKNVDGMLGADAMDAWRFGVDFGDIMMESTPHLYISVLPFTPRDSFVSRKYLERYPGLFTFDIDQPVSSSRTNGITQRVSSSNAAFSPKDTYVATRSENGEFVLWNYITGEHLAHWKPEPDYDTSEISDIVYSIDGELVYWCFARGDIIVWNVETKEARIERYEGIVDDDECHHCTISSDGRFIIWETKNEAFVIDRENRRVVKCLGKVLDPAISPSGNWIADPHEDGIYIWNTRNQTQHGVVPCNVEDGLVLTDSYIASENFGIIQIWDLQTFTKFIQIEAVFITRGFCFSPDDQYFFVTSEKGYSIWSVPAGELISQSYEDGPVWCLGFSHDSEFIGLYTGGTLHVHQWDKSIEPDDSRGNRIQDVDKIWLRGSYLILLHGNDDSSEKYLRISDITTTNTIIFEDKLVYSSDVSVSPDEETVCVAYIDSSRRRLCLWNNERKIEFLGIEPKLFLLLDKYLICARTRTIEIWDTRTCELSCALIEPYKIRCPDSLHDLRGSRFAVTYEDKMEVWDCESGNRIGETFTLESKYRGPMVISANGEHLIFMSWHGVDILDLTGARVSSIPFSDEKVPHGIPSPNGKYMAWADDDEIKLFDVDTETLLTGPSVDRLPVLCTWFSDDSKYIITAVPEFLVIWDIQAKVITKTIQYQFDGPQWISLNKRCLVVNCSSHSSRSRKCYVWDLDTYETMSTLYNAPPLPATDGPDIEPGTLISSKTETLDYALMAWKKASLPAYAKVDDHGWVLGLQGEPLFWIPPKMRQGFWFPCMMHNPFENVTKLNFTNFVHGSDWTKCKSRNN